MAIMLFLGFLWRLRCTVFFDAGLFFPAFGRKQVNKKGDQEEKNGDENQMQHEVPPVGVRINVSGARYGAIIFRRVKRPVSFPSRCWGFGLGFFPVQREGQAEADTAQIGIFQLDRPVVVFRADFQRQQAKAVAVGL